MKEQNFKKHLKENFEQKAPKEFTSNVMQKINASKSTYEPILSKTSIVAGVFLVIALFVMIIITTKQSGAQLHLTFFSEFLIANVNLLVLPFSIALLMFLKEWFYNRNTIR